MPHRDFDAARRERNRRADPVTFTLAGREFKCLLRPAIGDTFDLIDAPEPIENNADAARALARFIEKLLTPEHRDLFAEALRDPAADGGPVTADDLWIVASTLAAEFSARPTSPPDDSSFGRESAGPGSSPNGDGAEVATSPTSPSG